MSEQPLIELKKVSRWYDPDRKVLDRVDLAVRQGNRFAIVGPSGCGKSTLLNLLGTLDTPSEGSVHVGGRSLDGASEKDLARIRSEQIGFIFQLHHLLPQCSALENVLIPTLALETRPNPAELDARAKLLFQKVGLADKLQSRPAQLSGGERQRVAVIRALINQPRVILADEPTGALDEENARKLIDLLVQLNEAEELALVLVTHDRALAERIGNIRTLKSGKLV